MFEKYKPAVQKRTLLFISGYVWCVAGCVLFVRGFFSLLEISNNLLMSLLIGIVGGIIFYFVLFRRIAIKYSGRIKVMTIENPCAFSFFSIRSYLIMGCMITGGILVRTYAPIDKVYIFTFFIIMSIPLLGSALHFFREGQNSPKN